MTMNGSAIKSEEETLIARRTAELFHEYCQNIIRHTDRVFARLMLWQWLGAIAAAILISPRSWAGTRSEIHIHVIAAIVLGGVITVFPVFMAWRWPGRVLTRHTVAVGQVLM